MGTDLRDEIKRLTEKWYSLVGRDHHKDRDCHWYINETWSYGDYPTYTIDHYGYVFDEVHIKAETYEKAQMELIKLIKRAMKNEKAWALRMLKDPDGNIGDAKSVIELIGDDL